MKYLLVPFFALFSLLSYAQQNHFIYIQADNQQAFYVKLDKKIISSTASGYLIIPKLREGSYDLLIGFPKNEWPEQNVTCVVKQNDAGYLLKNFGEKGWGLFNFQTMDLVMATEKPRVKDSSTVNQNKDDAFANVLSAVVNDPSIKTTREITGEPKPEIKPDEKSIKQKDKVQKDSRLPKTKSRPTVAGNKSRIKKLQDNKTADSVHLVYVDMNKGVADTINVIIPPVNTETLVEIKKQVLDTLPVIAKPANDVMPVASTVIPTRQPENKEEKLTTDTVVLNNSIVNITAVDTANAIKPGNTVPQPVMIRDDQVISKPANKKNKKKHSEPKSYIVKSDVKETPVINDTTAVVNPEIKSDVVITDSVKAAPENKRSKRKHRQPKSYIVKSDIKETPVINDTTTVVQPEIKSDVVITDSAKAAPENKRSKRKHREPKTDIVKSDIKETPVVNDTTAAIQPEIKSDVVITDSAKAAPENKRSKRKHREAKTDIVKSDIKETPVVIDTTTVVQPEIKSDVVIVDSAKVAPENKRSKRKHRQPKSEIVKSDIKETPVITDTTTAVQPEIKPAPVVDSAKVTVANKRSKKKHSEPALQIVKTEQPMDKEKNDSSANLNPVVVTEKKEEPLKPVVIEKPGIKTEVPVNTEKKPTNTITPVMPKEPAVNNNNTTASRVSIVCKNMVDDDEYLKLHIKMEKSKNDDDKLYMAHKIFVKKCFSTRQIQRLSLLFADDAGKYKLFDEAYSCTYDLENFTSLESELKEFYYIKRFRAMIR
jgi:hypothetical protein